MTKEFHFEFIFVLLHMFESTQYISLHISSQFTMMYFSEDTSSTLPTFSFTFDIVKALVKKQGISDASYYFIVLMRYPAS